MIVSRFSLYLLHFSESWVEVQEQQERGTLTHTSSKEEMKQLLASAASEEEELSDSDVM